MEPTEVLGGRYRLVEPLGAGGMSVVWRAQDPVLGRPVAVKLLAGGFAGDTAFRRRLRTEAQAVAGLTHANVTMVYDFGESGGQPYVVMELVDGEPLSRRLAGGPLPWRTAVEVCAEVAAALSAAHAYGLVHRDVTPANIMLTEAGVKVVDFGVSAAVGANGRDGPHGTVLGTPAFLAPERLAGGPVGPAADVYALGLVLYTALAGELPWRAGTTTRMLAAHRYLAPRPLPPLPGAPRRLADLCARCLDKDPARRPTSAWLARELSRLAGTRVAVVDPVPPDAPAAPGPAATAPAATVPVQPTTAEYRLPRRRWPVDALVIGLAVILLAIAGGAGAVYLTRHGPPASAAPAAPAPTSARPVPAAQAGGCVVSYRVRTEWGDGATVDVTIGNTGTMDLRDWALRFDLPGRQRLDEGWNAHFSQKGSTVTVHSDGHNATIAAGAATSVGFTVEKHGGRAQVPDRFTLSGTRCH